MSSYMSHKKYSEGVYDIFEELPDGSTVCLACVFGIGNAEIWLRELASKSNSNFFALNYDDATEPAIHPGKSYAAKA